MRRQSSVLVAETETEVSVELFEPHFELSKILISHSMYSKHLNYVQSINRPETFSSILRGDVCAIVQRIILHLKIKQMVPASIPPQLVGE